MAANTNLSTALGKAQRVFLALYNAGVTDDDLQKIIDTPELAFKIAGLLSKQAAIEAPLELREKLLRHYLSYTDYGPKAWHDELAAHFSQEENFNLLLKGMTLPRIRALLWYYSQPSTPKYKEGVKPLGLSSASKVASTVRQASVAFNKRLVAACQDYHRQKLMEDPDKARLLPQAIDVLDLSERALVCLKRFHKHQRQSDEALTVGELIEFSAEELLAQVINLGLIGVQDVEQKLELYGLSLKK